MIEITSHTGTHIDTPLHFIPGGSTVSDMPLDATVGPCRVIEIKDKVKIKVAELEKHSIKKGERLLFKTRNSGFWARQLPSFQTDFAAIDASGAEWLVRRGVQLVGVDYLSVAPYKKGLETHRALLGAGVVVVEGLNLTGVSQGRYTLYCLPLKLIGSDGAPARAILVGV